MSGEISMRSVSECREQASWVYYGAVFEIKRRIPNYRDLWTTRVPYPVYGTTEKLNDIFEETSERRMSSSERSAF